MAGAEVLGRLTWRIGEVTALVDETPRVRSITMTCPGWPGHRPGQHVDLRLTAEDGYQAQRSYSIARPAEGELVTITVEIVDDGEVSPFLVEELRVGDRMEVRGPIGGYFVWDPDLGGPLQLIGGGSGVVPLMAMLRARVAVAGTVPVRYLGSARSIEDVLYLEELEGIAASENGVEVTHTLTRSHPEGWAGPTRRVDREMLAEYVWSAGHQPLCYVCGPTGFVEVVAGMLVQAGHDPGRVRTERFGPSGVAG